jgi:hypothetical protein
MSIQDIILKIKGVGEHASFRKSIGILGIILAGSLLLSTVFILGRISGALSTQKESPVEIIYPPLPNPLKSKCITKEVMSSISKAPSQNTSSDHQGDFAGSKTGKTYYPISCKSLNRIKNENRVYFTTQAEAKSAGYSASKACFK